MGISQEQPSQPHRYLDVEAKQEVSMHEVADGVESLNPGQESPEPVLTAEERLIDKRILRKIDTLILPLCAMNYFFSSMDRADIGNARIAGFEKDNHLTATQFSTVVSLFYVGYIICQPIGGLLIRKIETYLLLGMANIVWGILTIMLMFSKSMVLPGILRVFIGAAEGLTQINNVFLTMWYTRREIAVRTGIWYSCGVLAGSFNGIIAYGLQKNAHSSLKPWQLLFLVEGIFPIVFGPILIYFYPSSPEKVKKFFTPEEKALCIARTQRARNTAGARITLRGALSIFKSPETYGMWLAYFCVIWSSSGYGNFLPSIVNGLGYSAADSQLLTVPICVIGTISVNFWCWISDRFQLRGPLIIALALSTFAGFAILVGVETGTGPRLFALCWINFSLQPLIPLTLTFLFVDTVGLSRRALSIPIQNACGQFGGLGVSYTFTHGPRYLTGNIVTLCALGLLACLIAILDIYFTFQNRKKLAEMGSEKWQEGRLKSFDELGTAHPDFTFTI